MRDSEAEAYAELEHIVSNASVDAVHAFAKQVRNAGASTRDKVGMWANDGFKTELIGTAEQVADKIREYYKIGVDLILCGFYTTQISCLILVKQLFPWFVKSTLIVI